MQCVILELVQGGSMKKQFSYSKLQNDIAGDGDVTPKHVAKTARQGRAQDDVLIDLTEEPMSWVPPPIVPAPSSLNSLLDLPFDVRGKNIRK
jgi:hypothetical protein